MTQVVLTGGSGKLGRACLADLLEHGYSVTNVDLVRPPDDPCPFVRADLTDMGQTLEVLHQVDDRHRGVDAVVHLAAVPAPGWAPGAELFRNNTVSTYNVFAGARHLGIAISSPPPVKRSSGCRSTSPHPMLPSTRSTHPCRSRLTRCPKPRARNWQGTSAGGSRK